MDSRRKARENFGFLKVFGQDPVTDLGFPYRQGGGVGGGGGRILGSLTKSQVSLGLVDLWLILALLIIVLKETTN